MIGAGEGNRTLVIITKVDSCEIPWFKDESEAKRHHSKPPDGLGANSSPLDITPGHALLREALELTGGHAAHHVVVYDLPNREAGRGLELEDDCFGGGVSFHRKEKSGHRVKRQFFAA